MNGRSFSLQPFPLTRPLPSLEITGNISRCVNQLAVRYALRGRLAELALPAPGAPPTRRNGLWQATCFEFFLGVKNSPRYWEFNLSPAGPWNVYRFAAYRQGRQEEAAFASLPGRVRRRPDLWELALELDLAFLFSIVRPDQALEVGISAVIQLRDGELTYWALTHRGPQADFHRRDGFIIQLSDPPRRGGEITG